MKYSKIIALLLPFLAFAHSANAGVSDGTKIDNDTLAPFASWVEQETHVTIKAMPITTASSLRLKNALGLQGVQRARAAAAYLPGQIVISNVIWDPESVIAQSYIVHEMVHHAQLLSRKKYECHAAKEREAYMLQNKWLAEHDESPIVTQEWIDKISACGSSEYYDGD
jgi:hypothetical protein